MYYYKLYVKGSSPKKMRCLATLGFWSQNSWTLYDKVDREQDRVAFHMIFLWLIHWAFAKKIHISPTYLCKVAPLLKSWLSSKLCSPSLSLARKVDVHWLYFWQLRSVLLSYSTLAPSVLQIYEKRRLFACAMYFLYNFKPKLQGHNHRNSSKEECIANHQFFWILFL